MKIHNSIYSTLHGGMFGIAELYSLGLGVSILFAGNL